MRVKNRKQLAALASQGEGETLEFKRSTGELKEAMQTLCAFMNGSGGTVLFGVRPDGTVAGQDVSDKTLRDISQAMDRFEPPAHVAIERIRNPLIAGAFHRTGAVEVWGRGTNRVIAMCKKHGVAPPVFDEGQGFLTVTFKTPMVATGVDEHSNLTGQPESQPESRPDSQPESLTQRVLTLLRSESLGKAEISLRLGQKTISGQLNSVIRSLLGQDMIEYTIPDKPQSRLQKYRLTAKGRKMITKPGK